MYYITGVENTKQEDRILYKGVAETLMHKENTRGVSNVQIDSKEEPQERKVTTPDESARLEAQRYCKTLCCYLLN